RTATPVGDIRRSFHLGEPYLTTVPVVGVTGNTYGAPALRDHTRPDASRTRGLRAAAEGPAGPGTAASTRASRPHKSRAGPAARWAHLLSLRCEGASGN